MKYELGFIIGSNIPETEHQAIQQEILGYLEKIKAKTDKEFQSIGRKKLTYAIKKQKHGFYMFLEFELDKGDSLKDLDTKLRHNSKILRYLIIKKERAAKELEKKQAKPSVKTSQVKDESVDKKEVKAGWDDLDKRLDEILAKDSKID